MKTFMINEMNLSCNLVCSNCLYVEKRKSGDKLELLLDRESLLDAAHLVMKSMIMRKRRRSMVKHGEEYFDGDENEHSTAC